MQSHLVLLRRNLRAMLGTSHGDYQKLRLSRTDQLDEEDEEVIAGEGEPGDRVPDPDRAKPAEDRSQTPTDVDEEDDDHQAAQ